MRVARKVKHFTKPVEPQFIRFGSFKMMKEEAGSCEERSREEGPAGAGFARSCGSMTPIQRNSQPGKYYMKTTKLLLIIAAFAASTAVLSASDVGPIWEKTCQKCHGPDGKGATKMGQKMGVKDMTDAKYQATFKDEDAFKAIKEGIKDGDKTKMKPAEGVTDDDIKALVAKVRSFKQ